MKKILLLLALGAVVSVVNATEVYTLAIENKSKHKLYGWITLVGQRCSMGGAFKRVLFEIEPKSTKKVARYDCCVDQMELRAPSFGTSALWPRWNQGRSCEKNQKFEVMVDKKGQVTIEKVTGIEVKFGTNVPAGTYGR